MLVRRVNGSSLELYENGTELILGITETVVNGDLLMKLRGILRNDLVYEFDDELSAAVSVGKNVVLDFSDVRYIASAALKTLLRMQQKIDISNSGQEMRISNASDEVMKVFSESGLINLLQFEGRE